MLSQSPGYLEATKTTFSLKDPPVSVVRKLLVKLNERKDAGLDNIPSRLLKMAGNIIAPSLTQIFIKSINTGIFPTEWKLARVTPIFKKGKRDDPNNYRPISIIPTAAKIFEKIIYDQLCDYLKDNNLLTHCQFGFRSLHSTLTALVEATNSWSVNIDNGLVNGVIFIDLKKAFDTIDHTILIYESFGNMALTQEVSNGLNHIFVTETKNAAQMAIYQILPRFLVVSHKVAILVHPYS